MQLAEELRQEARAAPAEMTSGAFAGFAYAVETREVIQMIEWLVISDEQDVGTVARWMADRLGGAVLSDGEPLPTAGHDPHRPLHGLIAYSDAARCFELHKHTPAPAENESP